MLLAINFQDFLQMVMYIVPAITVFLICYFMLKKYLDSMENRARLEYKMKTSDQFNPLKLQAYERLTILLDRMSPENSILRVMDPKLNAIQFKTKLIHEVNEEFNHNISQQIYVSSQAWELIKKTKVQLLQIVERCYSDMNEQSSGTDLGKAILKEYSQMQDLPCQVVIQFLKKEMTLVF